MTKNYHVTRINGLFTRETNWQQKILLHERIYHVTRINNGLYTKNCYFRMTTNNLIDKKNKTRSEAWSWALTQVSGLGMWTHLRLHGRLQVRLHCGVRWKWGKQNTFNMQLQTGILSNQELPCEWDFLTANSHHEKSHQILFYISSNQKRIKSSCIKVLQNIWVCKLNKVWAIVYFRSVSINFLTRGIHIHILIKIFDVSANDRYSVIT